MVGDITIVFMEISSWFISQLIDLFSSCWMIMGQSCDCEPCGLILGKSWDHDVNSHWDYPLVNMQKTLKNHHV